MKVLGIVGSPRKGGNSDVLLERVLAGVRKQGGKTEKTYLGALRFKSCQGCLACAKTGKCVLKDGLTRVYKKIDEADGVVVASPVYFGTVSGQIKMMIDRIHCLWTKRYVLKKPPLSIKKRRGVFLCVSGDRRRKFFDNSEYVVKTFFNTLSIEYFGHIYSGGVEAKGDIKKKKTALNRAFRLGESIVGASQ